MYVDLSGFNDDLCVSTLGNTATWTDLEIPQTPQIDGSVLSEKANPTPETLCPEFYFALCAATAHVQESRELGVATQTATRGAKSIVSIFGLGRTFYY